MHPTLFPAQQKEHIHARVPHQRKGNKESEEISDNLDQNIAVTENQAY